MQLHKCKRQDGSTYWAPAEQVDNDDLLIDFIRDLHDDEFPNDWRYETIVDICTYLCDLVETIDSQSDAHDIAFKFSRFYYFNLHAIYVSG